MGRLHCLVFSFYREDPDIQDLLQPLIDCQMVRRKGSIFINCIEPQTYEAVSPIIVFLKPPFILLGLARAIVLHSNGLGLRKFPLDVPFHSDLMN